MGSYIIYILYCIVVQLKSKLNLVTNWPIGGEWGRGYTYVEANTFSSHKKLNLFCEFDLVA